MIYKLFLLGEKESFALVRIPMLEFSLHLKPVFVLKGIRYQVANYILPAFNVDFDKDGIEKHTNFSAKKEDILNSALPELYLIELPKF